MFRLILSSLAAPALWFTCRKTTLPPRWLNAGSLDFRRCVEVNGRRYYVEQVAFADYQQALNRYVHLIGDLENHAPLRELQSDYLDWTSALLRFDGYCIHFVRRIDKIRLIKSSQPMSLAEFERDLLRLAEKVR